MDKKIPLSIRIYESVSKAMEKYHKDKTRIDKGQLLSAAMVMFLKAAPEQQQRYVDLVMLGEGRAADSMVYDAIGDEINAQDARAERDREFEKMKQMLERMSAQDEKPAARRKEPKAG